MKRNSKSIANSKPSVRRGRKALPSQTHLDKRGRSEEDWFEEQLRNLKELEEEIKHD